MGSSTWRRCSTSTRASWSAGPSAPSTIERLTTAEEVTFHWAGSWSPDGETLLFSVQKQLQTDWDIWTLSGSTRETENLYDTPETIYLGAELSPSGRWVAFGAGPDATNADIYVEPFPPTGARRRISQNGGIWPVWSPDEGRLFYRPPLSAASGTTASQITLRSVDVVTEPEFQFGNELTPPIQGFTVVNFHRDYDITPDCEQLAMIFPAGQIVPGEASLPQINVTLNWFRELTERVPIP